MINARVASVEPDSLAEEAGILPGDIIVSINDHPLHDIIDYRFYSAEEEVDILVRRGDEDFLISADKDIEEPIGVDFEDDLFDGIRTCRNNCIFCFVQQLPKGMRRTLYVKDDDYRLSFLCGNFVTLTNVTEQDIERIIEQRLTPLYVSVHTTDAELRRKMVRGKMETDIMQQLTKLSEGGITLHTQIVLCPGVNDKEHLEKTVRDLASFYPSVQSIGIVPVGLTQHRREQTVLDTFDPEGAKKVISEVKKWQREFLRKYDTRLVWASDELYLVSGTQVPSEEAYEGYPQIENGIGLVRQFLDDARKVRRKLPKSIPHPIKATVVTASLAAPILQSFADELNEVEGLEIGVKSIKNEFFGESVTVAGLITGSDIRNQLLGKKLGDIVIVPDTMLRDSAFLDDVTIDDLSKAIKTEVIGIEPIPSALARALKVIK